MQRLHHSTHAQAQWGHESENERQMGHTAHSDNTRHADAAPRQPVRAAERSVRIVAANFIPLHTWVRNNGAKFDRSRISQRGVCLNLALVVNTHDHGQKDRYSVRSKLGTMFGVARCPMRP